MKDIILDVLRHTNFGSFECVKLQGDDNKVEILATDENKTLILNGQTKHPYEDFKGTFGMGNLKYLNGIANFGPFRTDSSTVKVHRRERNGEQVPESIEFVSQDKTKSTYRLMHESAIPKVAKFKGANWDIEFKPRKEKINEFSQLASLYQDMESYFSVRTDQENNLMFFLGEEEAASHKAELVFEKNVGTMNDTLVWPIGAVLQVLKLSETGDSKLRITKDGVMNIEIDSGLATYNYYLMASQR